VIYAETVNVSVLAWVRAPYLDYNYYSAHHIEW